MADKKQVATFSKKRILSAKKYQHDIDVISALLSDTKTYTLAEVDKILADWKKGKVK